MTRYSHLISKAEHVNFCRCINEYFGNCLEKTEMFADWLPCGRNWV